MARLNEREQEELRAMAGSARLRRDMRRVHDGSSGSLPPGGDMSADSLIAFLTQFNEFMNHAPKPFVPMKCCTIKM